MLHRASTAYSTTHFAARYYFALCMCVEITYVLTSLPCCYRLPPRTSAYANSKRLEISNQPFYNSRLFFFHFSYLF